MELLTAPDVLRRLDPERPVLDVRVLRNRVWDSLRVRRGSAAFGFVALLLAGAGRYGVVSYPVTLRRSVSGWLSE